MIHFYFLQYLEREDKISSMEIEIEEVRNELQNKHRMLEDFQDQINDLKVELASVREQKNSAMKEVNNSENLGYALCYCPLL